MKKIKVHIFTTSGEEYIGDEQLFSDVEYTKMLKDCEWTETVNVIRLKLDGSECFFNPKNVEAVFIKEI